MEQLGQIIVPLGFAAGIYFLMIRPQQKKEKTVKQMRNNLKVGDEITTIGGIYGRVTKIKEDTVSIEVGAERTKLTIAKWAIGSLSDESTRLQ